MQIGGAKLRINDPRIHVMPAITQQAHTLIDTLPDPTSWDDVAHAVDQARFQAAVRAGIAAAEQGRFASPSQLQAMLNRWGLDVAP